VSIRLTQREYIALIALTSGVILTLGVFLKPEQLPEPTISGEETLRLQTLTERRNLENLAAYISEVADGIQPGLVWLNEIAMTGLVWNQEGLIVTAGPNQLAPEEVTALTASGNITLEPQVLSENFRVSSLKAPNGPRLQPVRKSTTDGLTPGTWIIQIARQAGGKFLYTPGVYGGMASTKCGTSEYQAVQSNLPLTASALGGGLFDVDGNLLAVVLRCDDHFAAVMPAEVDREIAKASTFEGQLLQGYGLQVTGLDDVSRRYFQSKEGVMVREVMDGQPADAATLMPGDIITALDEAPVRVPEDLRPLTMATDRPGFQLELRRNRRIVRINLQPSGSRPPASAADARDRGIALMDQSQGYLVGTVVRGSRAARASIQAGDRLLQVNGKPPQSLAAVRKALSDSSRDPIFVLLHRGSRKIGVFLNSDE
jgi:serine protease Do